MGISWVPQLLVPDDAEAASAAQDSSLERSGVRYPEGSDINTVGEIQGKASGFLVPDNGPVTFTLTTKRETYVVFGSPKWYWEDLGVLAQDGVEVKVVGSKTLGAEILARTGADNVGGPMVTIGGGVVGDAIAGAMSSRFGIGSYFQFGTAEREADTVYMGMWPRQVFEKVGLFDEELVRNQDDELSYRIRKAGGRIIISPALRSRYQNRQSWRNLMRQFYEYGLWKTRVLQKHPRQMSVRHYVPPGFDAAVLAGLASGMLFGATGPMVSVAALGVYATKAFPSTNSKAFRASSAKGNGQTSHRRRANSC